jgi:predicted TPR repeat methyltransferase
MKRIHAALDAGDAVAARAACDVLLASSPTDARVLHCAACASLLEGDASAALPHATSAVKANSEQWRFRVTLGRALLRCGRADDAVAAFAHAARLSASTTTFHALAAAQGVAEQDAASAASYAKALALCSSSAPIETRVGLHYARGQALKRSGDRKRAAAAFRSALDLDPGHASSAYKLASLLAADGDGSVPTTRVARAPASYVAKLFDVYASTFEEHLTGHLHYRTPSELAADVARLFPARRWRRVLDLGCGTGLSGAAFDSTALEMVGIDLSGAMIEECRKSRGVATRDGRRALYSRLIVGDILAAPALLRGTTKGGDAAREEEAEEEGKAAMPNAAVSLHFDLILCCDTLVYVGALEPVFDMLNALLLVDDTLGERVFACSVELLDNVEGEGEGKGEGEGGGEKEPFRLLRTKRFAHRRSYVEATARAYGWSVRSMRRSKIRMNAGAPIVGLLCVFAHE